MNIQIINKPISKDEVRKAAQESFGDMVKAVVDIEQGIIALGGEMHADGEKILIDNGSKQASLWGFNLYPEKSEEEWIEYRSLINIRPSIGNRSMTLEDGEIKKSIRLIIEKFIQ